MSGVRPGKGRKRRITSSKTQTESTSDRSFTSCWSIHHPWQKRSSHVTLRVPASQSLRPRSIIQGPASCACICSCRPAGARAVPVVAVVVLGARAMVLGAVAVVVGAIPVR